MNHPTSHESEYERLLTALQVETQIEAAGLLGITQSLLNDCKRRGGRVSTAVMEKASVHGISPDYILHGKLPMYLTHSRSRPKP